MCVGLTTTAPFSDIMRMVKPVSFCWVFSHKFMFWSFGIFSKFAFLVHCSIRCKAFLLISVCLSTHTNRKGEGQKRKIVGTPEILTNGPFLDAFFPSVVSMAEPGATQLSPSHWALQHIQWNSISQPELICTLVNHYCDRCCQKSFAAIERTRW